MVYLEPIMMATDMFAAIINQRYLIRCIKRLNEIDYKLAKENIFMNYRPLRVLSVVLIVLIISETMLIIALDISAFERSIWFFMCMETPLCVGSLAKTVFVLLVSNIRAKYQAINSHLDDLCVEVKAIVKENDEIFLVNEHHGTLNRNKPVARDETSSVDSIGLSYLHKEIKVTKKFKDFKIPTLTIVRPFDFGKINKGSAERPEETFNAESDREIPAKIGKSPDVDSRLQERLTNLCSIYDEISETAGMVNSMFEVSILLLMVFAFVNITTRLYNVYRELVKPVSGRFFLKKCLVFF